MTAPSSTDTPSTVYNAAPIAGFFPWCHVMYTRLGGRVYMIRLCQCDRVTGPARD